MLALEHLFAWRVALSRRPTVEYLKTEAASGLILVTAALAALILANSPWASDYFSFIHASFTVRIGPFEETADVLDWVKQGLMAIFFFVVGMEIKFEVLKGELANPRRLAMPVLVAVGGMALPALIYLALNAGRDTLGRGAWAVPTATDIAFALAALSAVSKSLPASLRVFLLTLAIADDLGAVGLIGVLFSQDLQLRPLLGRRDGQDAADPPGAQTLERPLPLGVVLPGDRLEVDRQLDARVGGVDRLPARSARPGEPPGERTVGDDDAGRDHQSATHGVSPAATSATARRSRRRPRRARRATRSP